jgi:hypothetical protein
MLLAELVHCRDAVPAQANIEATTAIRRGVLLLATAAGAAISALVVIVGATVGTPAALVGALLGVTSIGSLLALAERSSRPVKSSSSPP